MPEVIEPKGKPILRLVGEDGNAFAILGRWKSEARKAGWSVDEIKFVIDDAMLGDYNHLLAVIIDNSEEPED